MKHRLSVSILAVALSPCCTSDLNVRQTTPGHPGGGVLYRLPVPRVQITEKRYAKDTNSQDERIDYEATLVAVPSDTKVYHIAVDQGTFTSDSVTVKLGNGGVLESYSQDSIDQTGELITSLGKLTLTAAAAFAAAGAPTPGEITRPAPRPGEMARIVGYRALLDDGLKRLETYKKKIEGYTLSLADATANQAKAAALNAKIQPLQTEKTTTDVRIVQLRTQSHTGVLTEDERELLASLAHFSKDLASQIEALSAAAAALPIIAGPVNPQPLTEKERSEFEALVKQIAAYEMESQPSPTTITDLHLVDIKYLPSNTTVSGFLQTLASTTQDGDFVAIARKRN